MINLFGNGLCPILMHRREANDSHLHSPRPSTQLPNSAAPPYMLQVLPRQPQHGRPPTIPPLRVGILGRQVLELLEDIPTSSSRAEEALARSAPRAHLRPRPRQRGKAHRYALAMVVPHHGGPILTLLYPAARRVDVDTVVGPVTFGVISVHVHGPYPT